MLGVHELDVHHSPALKNYFYQTYPLKKKKYTSFYLYYWKQSLQNSSDLHAKHTKFTIVHKGVLAPLFKAPTP